jgi:hypothetical protein
LALIESQVTWSFAFFVFFFQADVADFEYFLDDFDIGVSDRDVQHRVFVGNGFEIGISFVLQKRLDAFGVVFGGGQRKRRVNREASFSVFDFSFAIHFVGVVQ